MSEMHGWPEGRPTKYYHGRRAISDFFVLCSAELDHALRGWVGDLDFSQYRMTIIREYDAAHWIEEHLQHCLRAQT